MEKRFACIVSNEFMMLLLVEMNINDVSIVMRCLFDTGGETIPNQIKHRFFSSISVSFYFLFFNGT